MINKKLKCVGILALTFIFCNGIFSQEKECTIQISSPKTGDPVFDDKNNQEKPPKYSFTVKANITSMNNDSEICFFVINQGGSRHWVSGEKIKEIDLDNKGSWTTSITCGEKCNPHGNCEFFAVAFKEGKCPDSGQNFTKGELSSKLKGKEFLCKSERINITPTKPKKDKCK